MKNKTTFIFCKTVLAWSFLLAASLTYGKTDPSAIPFDHAKTGFVLRDVHTTLKCEQCHVDGIFKNTPRDCAGCHSTGSRVGATPKPPNHVLTNKSCDTCHVSMTSFLVRSFKHAGITNGCSACHNGQSLGVTSKPANHFPTTLPCENCHNNTNTFTSWKMDHTGITTGCETCHTGQFAGVMSKPAMHIPIPAGAGCETCHNTTTFLGAMYDHTGVAPGSCANCHTGQYPGVVSKPTMHISTTAACDTCHTQANTGNYTSFLGAFYDHTGVASGSCSNCHNGSYPGVLGKPTNHIPTTAACDTCHTQANTNNYLNFLGAKYDHAGVVAGSCANCHNGLYPGVTSKPAAHIPVTAACDNCHTQGNTSNYSSFLGAVYNHVTPSPVGTCSTCHTGTYPNVYGKNYISNHIVTAAQCDTCHTQSTTQNYTTFLGALIDHSTISPPVASRCSTCHDGVQATGKPAIHITTSLQCDQCHTQSNTGNYTTFLGAPNPHSVASFNTGIAGTCASCHNGNQAVGQPTGHIPTGGQSCDVCHTPTNTSNYTTFLGATNPHLTASFNVGIAGTCSTCHGGTYPGVTSKPATHVITTAQCDTCHTATNTGNYTTFLGATYNHSGVVAGSCGNCHNGVQATGKPATHIPTTLACDQCHTASNTVSYTTFLATIQPHTISSLFNTGNTPVVAGNCSICHNGAQALGKPATHIATSAQCDGCHTQSNTSNYTTFLGAVYVHDATMAGKCANSGCHDGSNATGKSVGHVPVSVSCDSGGCHAMYNGTTVTSFASGTMVHSVVAGARCDSCHNGSYTTQGVYGAVAKVSNHIPTTITGALDCTTCHTVTAPNTKPTSGATAWASEKMNHNGAQGGGVPIFCVTCHLRGVTYLGNMEKMSHNGASTTKDCSSSSCHKPLGRTGTTYVNWN